MNQEDWKESKIFSSLENEVDSLKIKAKNMLHFLEDLTTSLRIFINAESDINQLKSHLLKKLHSIDEFIDKGKKGTFPFFYNLLRKRANFHFKNKSFH